MSKRPISEQVEHEDIPFLDDLDPEPSPTVSIAGWLCVAVSVVLMVFCVWLVAR